jgi:hypothetical protein
LYGCAEVPIILRIGVAIFWPQIDEVKNCHFICPFAILTLQCDEKVSFFFHIMMKINIFNGISTCKHRING